MILNAIFAEKHKICLLYECINTKTIWHHAINRLQTTIDSKSIIYGIKNEINKTYIISLISFFIYKEWIMTHNKKIKRSINSSKQFIMNEIRFKLKIFKELNLTHMQAELCKLL